MRVLKGKVIKGENIGKKQGYPTANLSRRVLIGKNLSPGVYIACATMGRRDYQALVIIGVPSKKDPQQGKVEVFFLDFKGNLYGKYIFVKIFKKIRPLKFYQDHEKLLNRIRRDITVANYFFKSDK